MTHRSKYIVPILPAANKDTERKTLTLPKATWAKVSECVRVGNVDNKRGQASTFLDLAVLTTLTILTESPEEGHEEKHFAEIVYTAGRLARGLTPEQRVAINTNLTMLAMAILSA